MTQEEAIALERQATRYAHIAERVNDRLEGVREQLERFILARVNAYAKILGRTDRFNAISWDRFSLNNSFLYAEKIRSTYDRDICDTIDMPTRWLWDDLEELKREVAEQEAQRQALAAEKELDAARKQYELLQQRFGGSSSGKG